MLIKVDRVDHFLNDNDDRVSFAERNWLQPAATRNAWAPGPHTKPGETHR